MLFLDEMNCLAPDAHNFFNITRKHICNTNLTCALCNETKVLNIFRRVETLLSVFQAERWKGKLAVQRLLKSDGKILN